MAYGTYVAPTSQATGPALTINAQSGLYPISRDIYGLNSGGDQSLNVELKIPVQRWGGDATSRYNWKVDSSNSGFDWYFMGGNGSSTPTANATVDGVIKAAQAASGKSVITVPMVGYLTSPSVITSSNPLGLIKDRILRGRTISGTQAYVNSTSVTNCSFPVNTYGAQQSVNPYVTVGGARCGNSILISGTQLTLTEPEKLLNHINITAAWNQEWLQYLVQTYGTAAKGGVAIYQLDNEPSGWGNTHRDVRPETPTGAELIQMTLLHAPVLKAVDPSALVLGPSDYGYQVYGTGSGANNYAPQYLAAMASYEKQNGKRILDYFDEHYYPFETGVALSSGGSAATQALRLQSTRSLWDPTYPSAVSWIKQPIQLLPMLHSYIDKNYRGTKLAITEYNFGAPESINGALTEADVLGIFAREQVDLATEWSPPTSTQPEAYAFRMYLNYDTNGSSFGDQYVTSQSADQGQLSVYGALRGCDEALTIMTINKTANTIVSTVGLSGFIPASKVQVYNYSEADLTKIVRQPDVPVASSGFTAQFPGNSITLFVIAAK
jgi:hypothetical protein